MHAKRYGTGLSFPSELGPVFTSSSIKRFYGQWLVWLAEYSLH